MASIYCTVQWPLWYTVQNNTCWFILCVREYTVDIVLYVDINREIFFFAALLGYLFTFTSRRWYWPGNTFSLFLCPHLLLVATRWHWRVSKWTLYGARSSLCPHLWHGRKKKSLSSPFSQSQTGVITNAFAERRRRESKQEHEFSFKNLIQMERCNRRGEWGEGGEHMKRKRETLENAKSEKERNKMKLRKCAFLLSGSALGRWRCCLGLGGWVVLCYDWVLSVKRSREVLSVLEHLHAGLNQGRGLCVWWNFPRIWIVFFVFFSSHAHSSYQKWNPVQ